ncbi:MAG: single-stranded-DNA-specific exonuclease RecJ [Alteromonadaceae bacterium]|nr:MAG: single-stranded-DNA-specific exonuclease RecJ [Alteromonadaceae bacterium]
MKKKIVRRDNAANFHNINDMLSTVYKSRGATQSYPCEYSLKQLHMPHSMVGLEHAAELLAAALEGEKRLLIVGDFDADGATSTALCMRCFEAFGHKNVDYLVPNRFEFGYGLSPEIVGVALERRPDYIITVDNGISSIQGVARAKAAGVRVIITDHHLPGRELPDADAIVNPNLEACRFPSKNLAGVGVAFYLMSALRAKLREKLWFERKALAEPNLANYLDLVALGTVADVVPLDHNNRILVANGLSRMRAGRSCPGIAALLEVANKPRHTLSATDMGFAVGPRLNAAGRLHDMTIGVRCLLSDSRDEAMLLAKDLDDMNQDRKLIEGAMQQEALTILQQIDAREMAEQRHGVCLYKAEWHQGVIGILASRIKDRLHRPTVIFANGDNGVLKGSGRSIPGIHLRDVLDRVATQNPGLLDKFGGHAMAAGMSIKEGDFKAFEEAFDVCVKEEAHDECFEAVVLSDGELDESGITLESADAIRAAGPWGQHFTEPMLDDIFNIVQQRIVGTKHLKLILCKERASNVVFDAIAFNVDLDVWPNEAQRAHVVFRLDINEFRGRRTVQLLVEYLLPL